MARVWITGRRPVETAASARRTGGAYSLFEVEVTLGGAEGPHILHRKGSHYRFSSGRPETKGRRFDAARSAEVAASHGVKICETGEVVPNREGCRCVRGAHTAARPSSSSPGTCVGPSRRRASSVEPACLPAFRALRLLQVPRRSRPAGSRRRGARRAPPVPSSLHLA